MASKSKLAMNRRKIATVAKYAAKRAQLKETIRSPKSSDDERQTAMDALHALPRNASPTRIRNRCELSGRPRGYYRKFGLSRIALRELALQGNIPGVTKSSW